MSRHPYNVLRRATLAIWLSTRALSAENPLCEASAETRKKIEEASSGLASAKATVEEVIEPLRGLRENFPKDLFVHLRYQDVIHERGVEGHLKEMSEDYAAEKNNHPNDPFYLYLFGRALEGRATPEAISTMEEVIELDQSFALAHRTLAEIYGSARFHDRKKEKAERAAFHRLCPKGDIPRRPVPLPQPGDLSQAERLLKGKDDQGKAKVPELVTQAMEQDGWRLQRVRSFDWYTVEEKKQVGRQGLLTQWKAWGLLVRYHRAAGQEQEAKKLLEAMQGRMERIHSGRDPDVFWAAGSTLTELYVDGKQPDSARKVLKQMEKFLEAKPDRRRSAQLSRLKSKLMKKPRYLTLSGSRLAIASRGGCQTLHPRWLSRASHHA